MKRGFQKQMSLPFDADLTDEVFRLFEPELRKWHEFENKHKSFGHEYYWWSSRFYDWLEENQKIKVEKKLINYPVFPRIWERYEMKITRHNWASGVPNKALELYV